MLDFCEINGKLKLSEKSNNLTCGILGINATLPGNDNFYKPFALKLESMDAHGGTLVSNWSCPVTGIQVVLELSREPYGLNGRIKASGRGSAVIRLVWELPEGRYFPFVPAFMYGYNRGGGSKWATYPQLKDEISGGFEKPWTAEEWLVRTDRSSHGFTSCIGEKAVFALGGRDICRYEDGSLAEKTGIGISCSRLHRISYSLGFINAPYTYSVIPGRNYHGRPEGYISLDKGAVECEFYLLTGAARRAGDSSAHFSGDGSAYFSQSSTNTGDGSSLFSQNSPVNAKAAYLLREFYALLHDEVDDSSKVSKGENRTSAISCCKCSPLRQEAAENPLHCCSSMQPAFAEKTEAVFPVVLEDAVNAISRALVDYGYCERASNFYITMTEKTSCEDGNGELSFNSAWAGGLRTAFPLLAAGGLMSNGRWLECARSVLDNIAANAISKESGLFFENYDLKTGEWNTRGWWYRMLEKPGHSAYINGQACFYLLSAYEIDADKYKKAGIWLSSAKKVLDKVISTRNANGGFGYTYNEKDGSILDGKGFSGCWFIPAIVLLYRITGAGEYLTAAEKAMNYYRRYVVNFDVSGGPHDIFKSPDEEGILAWIKASMLIHSVTGNRRYLEDLVAGLEYEFSWKFSYNAANEVEPLKTKNWCSTGGSVTSVNNSHIHPMGSSVLDCILYAADKTGDPYILSRFRDTLRWTLNAYLHFDGDYGWGKKGMINERFCYSDSLLAERYPDGNPAGTWFCAHSWASGAVLEGLVGLIPYNGNRTLLISGKGTKESL